MHVSALAAVAPTGLWLCDRPGGETILIGCCCFFHRNKGTSHLVGHVRPITPGCGSLICTFAAHQSAIATACRLSNSGEADKAC